MTKTFCDRCEKEIPQEGGKAARFTIPGNRAVVLCVGECFPELLNFLKPRVGLAPEEEPVSRATGKAREE